MQLVVGDIVEGKVTGITNFGVFVEIGEGKTGMVHISEVAQTYVNQISDFVKVGDKVKAKVLNVSDEGKISLSIKKAQEPKSSDNTEKSERAPKERRPRTQAAQSKPDMSYVWTSKRSEPTSFEDMMSKFKQTSDEKFSDLKRKNFEIRRPRRGSGDNF